MPKSCLTIKVNLILVFLFSALAVHSQLKLKVMNEDDSSAVSFAPIRWTILSTGQSLQSSLDEYGEITIDSRHSKVAILISYLGYEIKRDTFSGLGNFFLFLKHDMKYLPEAVITDQYTAISPDKSINRILVIDKKKILNMAATNLNDLLSNQLNIKLNQDNILGSSLSLMGISGQNVKILIDGVPVIGRMNGNVDLSQINLNDIERIEIVEGPLSVAYGTNALAGAINIITHKKQLHKISLNATTYNESVGRYNTSFTIGLRKINGVYQISSGRNYFDGWSDVTYIRFQEWKPKEQWFGKIQYLRKIGLFDLTIKSEFFTEQIINKGLPRQPYQETAFDEYYHTQRWDNAITATSKLPQNRYLNLMLAYNTYSRTKNRYLFNRVNLEKTLVPEDIEQDTSLFSALVLRGTYTKSLLNAKLNYQIGYDINRETGSGQKLSNRINNIHDYAAFISMEFNPSLRWHIKPAFRYAYNSSYTSIPLPSLNLKYSTKSKVMIRGSYARGFRAPDLKELYLFFVDVNHNITGNPNLQAEKSHNFQLSANKKILHKTYWLQPDIAFYYNSISNRIFLSTIKDTKYTYRNLDHFKSISINLGCNYKIKTLSGQIGLANTSLSTHESGFSNPTNTFEISTNTSYLHKKSGINTSVFVKLNGKAINFISDDFGNLTQSTLPAYAWADLTIQKSFFHEKWTIGIGSKNLLNVKTLATNGSNGGSHSANGNLLSMGMGRLYFIKLDYNFVRK